MQEARGEGDGEGDPQDRALAAAGRPQALQSNPPRLPAAPFCFYIQRQRRRQIARLLLVIIHYISCSRACFRRSSLWSGDAAFYFISFYFSFWLLQAGFKYRGNADCCI